MFTPFGSKLIAIMSGKNSCLVQTCSLMTFIPALPMVILRALVLSQIRRDHTAMMSEEVVAVIYAGA